MTRRGRFATNRSRFGMLLRERREMLEITREEFGKHVGVSVFYMDDLESRGTKRPSRKLLKRIVLAALAPSAKDIPRFIKEELWSEVDTEKALELILSSLDIDPAPFQLWIPIRAVKPGTAFVTKEGHRGLKTNLPDAQAVSMNTGGKLALSDGEETLVREIKLTK